MEQNLRPLDLNKFRDLVQQESARLKLRSFSGEGESSFTLALALSAAVKKIFFEKTGTTFSSEPVVDRKPITLFFNTMRVDAMEKFNTSTVFSSLQFAANDRDLERREYMLTLTVFLEKEFLSEFLRMLQYPLVDYEEDIELKDGCGTLVNLIAGQYKREMALLGYKDLMMSHFVSFMNFAPEGVMIPRGVTEKFELSFEVEGQKRLIVEMVTLDMLPKWKTHEKTSTKRILIVDDDVTFVATVEPFLRSQGFEVMVAFDGKEGIKMLKEAPHLIILDVMMPKMDGYEFILEKKKLEGAQQVPVIVLTAKEGMSEMFRIEGAREYLLKPFQPSVLLKSIQRCI